MLLVRVFVICFFVFWDVCRFVNCWFEKLKDVDWKVLFVMRVLLVFRLFSIKEVFIVIVYVDGMFENCLMVIDVVLVLCRIFRLQCLLGDLVFCLKLKISLLQSVWFWMLVLVDFILIVVSLFVILEVVLSLLFVVLYKGWIWYLFVSDLVISKEVRVMNLVMWLFVVI